MDNPSVAEELVVCIMKRCERLRSAAKDDENPVSKNTIRNFADHVVVMFENSREAAAVSEDVGQIADLLRALRNAEELLANLSIASKRKLNYAVPVLKEEEREVAFGLAVGPTPTSKHKILTSRSEALRTLTQGVAVLHRDPNSKRFASNKRNYEAAAVVAACKKIWREELGGKEPPSTLNANRINHPFYLFIEDVFCVLGMNEVTPTGALNSLMSLGGEEFLTVSIQLG